MPHADLHEAGAISTMPRRRPSPWSRWRRRLPCCCSSICCNGGAGGTRRIGCREFTAATTRHCSIGRRILGVARPCETRRNAMPGTVAMKRPKAVARQATAATTEPRWVRWLLIGITLAFLALFLLVPLLVVFRRGVAAGLGGLRAVAVRRRRTWSAIRLTLLVAADRRADQHGVRRAGGLGHRQVPVRRQERADHADRSALQHFAGHRRHDLRAVVRPAGLVRAVARGARHPHRLRDVRASCWPRCSSRFRSWPAN